ncbi:MAG TPA: sigma-54 dependent transcriptional regulator [Planctomycetota bacterium]|nr:sigma-54 dependent transcriptional regulator [Planctomycetota bacterium]
MKKGTILIIDDDPIGLETLAEGLHEEGYEALAAPDGQAGLAMLAERSDIDAVLTDLKMQGVDGMEVLRRARSADESLPVVLITAYASLETAIEAMKIGAFDYVTKPIDLRRVVVVVEKAVALRTLTRENCDLKRRLDEKFGFENIIGRSEAMMKVFQMVRQVADARTVVLIDGESGTGKELVAQAIHNNSSRGAGPFIGVNCAALTETLLESELFGHEKGAFTGAISQKKGRFELADGGTLFLDEVGDMPLPMQTKLLRVLQEYRFERVGGTQTIKVDVRVITATNTSLEDKVKAGTFREDLFYRLNVVAIHVPPLRERRDDIPLLACHFARVYAEQNNRPVKTINPQAMDVLCRHDWPGNVRELQNVIENMVITSQDDVLGVKDLPERVRPALPASTGGFPVGITMREMEERAIRETLDKVGGNRKKAADVLGIGLRTLHRKLREYGM